MRVSRTEAAARAAKSRYRVPYDGSFRVADARTAPPEGAPQNKRCRARLDRAIATLRDLQERLNAEHRWALLIVFQAMDAAGKDGTIRAVMTGINPAGVEVHSFKQPNSEELDHDFLWRTSGRLPERGRIGIFNRSFYEEVLVARVHPELLAAQHQPVHVPNRRLWAQRCESIRDHEKHLARSGTVILKFWLNVSREEQRKRFLSRIEKAEKNWKFQAADVRERERWNDYMAAYEDALRETSRPWAPWYAIPADDKDYMRMNVAELVVETLRLLDPRYPRLPKAEREELARLQKKLRTRRA